MNGCYKQCESLFTILFLALGAIHGRASYLVGLDDIAMYLVVLANWPWLYVVQVFLNMNENGRFQDDFKRNKTACLPTRAGESINEL